MFDGLFSAAGSIAGSLLSADAVKEATQMQIDALNRQREFVFQNLNPNVVQAQATAADIQNAQARLALQAQIDPALYAARYQSQQQLLDQAAKIGSEADVAAQAKREALAGTPGMEAAKNRLVDEAMKELKAGATLPPDVQAELVKAGLERSGMVTGSASGRGIGGQQLRTLLGSAGVQLQAQRQQAATNLLAQAQNLESSRQNILQSLFPRLSATQLQNLGATQGVLGTSAGMLPSAGLSGQNIANIMLARVGATNQLAQSAASVGAQGIMGAAQGYGSALTAAGAGLDKFIPTSTISGWFSGPSATQSEVDRSLSAGPIYR